MADEQSTTPWRCEVAWHTHTTDQRGPTCRPDSAMHPEMSDQDENWPPAPFQSGRRSESGRAAPEEEAARGAECLPPCR